MATDKKLINWIGAWAGLISAILFDSWFSLFLLMVSIVYFVKYFKN